MAGALEGLLEKLANIKASGRGEVAPRIIGDVIPMWSGYSRVSRGGQAMTQEPDPVAYVKACVKWTWEKARP